LPEEIALEMLHQVQLVGLPNEILNDDMFPAVLQQAQLKGSYTGFSLTPGTEKPWGEAVINLVSHSCAEWCAYHFHGCSWMADGTEVSAQLLQPENFDHEVALEAMPMLDETWLEAWYPDACAMEQLLMEGMGDEFEAPVLGHEFEAPVLGLEAEPPQDVSLDSLALVPASTGQLSAEAPVFVPGQKSMAFDQGMPNNSDVSTEDGSESEEEKARIQVAV